MVEVDIKELEEQLNELNQVIQDYEYYSNQIYHEFQNVSFHWNDHRKQKLFLFVDTEKKKSQQIITDLKQQYQIYLQTYKNYCEIGKKIQCNLDAKEFVLRKIDLVINQVEEILTRYDNLGDLSFFRFREKIYNEKEILRNQLEILYEIRKIVKEKYAQIERIESKTQQELSKNTILKISLNLDVGRI